VFFLCLSRHLLPMLLYRLNQRLLS
jgi:hypothetical protein